MVLAALPATPVQLVHACHQIGYEVVVPASWGDELVAQAVLEDLQHRGRDPVIQCTCPLVRERLLASGQHLLPSMVQTASPPVAAARYARAAFSPRAVHITYIGACPGASSDAIDQRFLPDEFLRALDERGTVLADMPSVFDSVLPPDRRRYYSLPGGCPSQEALWEATDGRMLREVTQPTFSTDLAQTLVWREYVMVDVAPSLACACAGSCGRVGPPCGRVAVMALEPPRAGQPIVVHRPDFAAPEAETPPPQPSSRPPNGTAPLAAETPESQPRPAESPAEFPVSPAQVRVRRPAGLPRAYLAKRRRSGASVPSEAAAPAPEPPAPEAPEEPNETTEVSRAIAVHVEPEAQPPMGDALPPASEEERAPPIDYALAASVYEAEVDGGQTELSLGAAIIAQQAPAPAPAPPPTQATSQPDDVAEHEPGELTALMESSPVQPPSELAPPNVSRPLRVEVEIYEEVEPSPPEIVLPETPAGDAAQPGQALPEAIPAARPAWGDFLIASWLVLVASAVIASLLWRR